MTTKGSSTAPRSELRYSIDTFLYDALRALEHDNIASAEANIKAARRLIARSPS